MNPQISVIVPVYKVEPYLDHCLDSILKQSYKDFEVIMIDDGSPDNSVAICREYVEKDDRFKLIRRENGGLSAARNTGIENASGTYLAFVDSDDSAEPRMLEVLLEALKASDAQMAVCGVNTIYPNHKASNYPHIERFTCSAEEAYRLMYEGKKIPGGIWCKLIRRDAVGDVRFPEGLTYEDAYFTADLVESIESVAVVTEPLYNYLIRRESITTSRFSPKAFDVVTVYRYVYDRIIAYFPSLRSQLDFRIYLSHFVVFDRMLQLDDYRTAEGYRSVLDFLRAHTKEIITNPHFQKPRKIAAMALAVNVRLYRCLLKLSLKRLWGTG